MARIVIDAGHGGVEPGSIYEGRREKDDNLRLALAVGDILEKNGIEVVYTRTTDVYDSPLEKAEIGNQSGADFFISIHRNAMPVPGSASGVESLVYSLEGPAVRMAENIDRALARVGFADLGVKERPNLIVLKRSGMPAVLVEAGFLDNEADNQLFDEKFDQIARAIADGILESRWGPSATGETPIRWYSSWSGRDSRRIWSTRTDISRCGSARSRSLTMQWPRSSA